MVTEAERPSPPNRCFGLGRVLPCACALVLAGAREQYGDAAIFFDRTNEAQLAECIKRLLDDAQLRKTLIGKINRSSMNR